MSDYNKNSLLNEIKRFEDLSDHDVMIYYGEISQDFSNGCEENLIQTGDLKHIQKAVLAAKGDRPFNPLCLFIQSHGGDFASACAIIQKLREQFPSIYVVVPTIAKSSATVIALAGDELYMVENQSAISDFRPSDVGGNDVDGELKEKFLKRCQAIFREGLFKDRPESIEVLLAHYASKESGEVHGNPVSYMKAKKLIPNVLSTYSYPAISGDRHLGPNIAHIHRRAGQYLRDAELQKLVVFKESIIGVQPDH